MAYDLGIGEFEKYKEDGYTFYNCKEIYLDNAPAFGEPTDFTNKRWPGYTAWSEFCAAAKLSNLFFDDKSGLLSSHPGHKKLNKKHQKAIHNAYNQFYKENPDINAACNGTDKQQHAVRLEWLKFWTDYALENIKNPYFINS